MVGISGVVGDPDCDAGSLETYLVVAEDERQTRYRDEETAIRVSSHPQFHEDQPATGGDDGLVWIHGEVYGFEGPDGYVSRDTGSTGAATYCAELYEERGIDFLEGLNGEFAGVVLDRSDGVAHLFTDRIGSRPLFYAPTDDAFLFASRLQSIGLHPAVSPSFDREYLAEYFGVQKAFGTATVLSDVSKVGPGRVLTVDLDGTVRGDRVYWSPEYRPVDRSPAELAAVVAETFEAVFDDRLRDDLEYGVMLSGGTDSRLVLGCARDRGHDPTAFHMTNWMSREARTAERVAHATGVDFRLLRRDRDYHERLLERVPEFTNFVGTFDESIATGFADELAAVDVLLTGYLGDTMFGTYPLYFREWALPFRFERPIGSVTEYVERYLDRYETPAEVPDYLDAPAVAAVMTERVRSDGDRICHHGVDYRSLRELQLCEYYPLTNQYASANADSLRQIAGHWSPFFDNRLIDLHLSIPVKDRIRYAPIDLGLCEVAPSLAEIPHGWSGVPIDRSGRTGPGLLVHKAVRRLEKRIAEDPPPEPYLDHRPWIDEGELIREHDFVERSIERNADLIASLPFLDREGIDRCYREHLEGTDNWRELYALVTLLESPVAERIATDR